MTGPTERLVSSYADTKLLLDTEKTICASRFSWSPTASFRRGDYDILSMLRDEVHWYGL